VKLYLVSLPMMDTMSGGVRHIKAFTVKELRDEWLIRAQAMHDEILGSPTWTMNGKPFKDQYILSEVEVESNLDYLKHLGREIIKETIAKCSESI
jgi:hypothetical protein